MDRLFHAWLDCYAAIKLDVAAYLLELLRREGGVYFQ